MKNLFIEKTTIDWDRKTRAQAKGESIAAPKVRNLKRSGRYGYGHREVISKYGLRQYIERSDDYADLYIA